MSTRKRDGEPMRMCCEHDDGTSDHLAVSIELPFVVCEAIVEVGGVRCPCGGVLVLDGRGGPR
jgi:hypothetical protein